MVHLEDARRACEGISFTQSLEQFAQDEELQKHSSWRVTGRTVSDVHIAIPSGSRNVGIDVLCRIGAMTVDVTFP